MINDYFKDYSNSVDNATFIVDSEIHKRKINDFLGIIEGKLRFVNYILDVLEVIEITDKQLFNVSSTKFSHA